MWDRHIMLVYMIAVLLWYKIFTHKAHSELMVIKRVSNKVGRSFNLRAANSFHIESM